MKLAIVGSRTFDDYDMAESFIDKVIGENHYEVSQIISGGARGADALAERYAALHGIETLILRPDWKRIGRSAGFRRNEDIIAACDACIAFWDGASKGTRYDIELCEKAGKAVFVCELV